MNLEGNENKDFIDKFIDYFEPYQKSGVRFAAVAICFFILFIIGTIIAPSVIRSCQRALPFSIQFLQLSPFELIFNYLKIGFFFSLFMTSPYFIYQFGKLKLGTNVEQKTNLIISAFVLFFAILLATFLTYKFVFPFEIVFLYGLNLNVAQFTTGLSAVVSTFIFTFIMVLLVILLPAIRILIKKSLLFNYATLIVFKKPIMIYLAVLSALLALPIEIISLGFVFLIFFMVYKMLIAFAKKRD